MWNCDGASLCYLDVYAIRAAKRLKKRRIDDRDCISNRHRRGCCSRLVVFIGRNISTKGITCDTIVTASVLGICWAELDLLPFL